MFSFGNLGILVESADRSHLAWLAEFLGPHFEVRASGAHACRVRLVEDRARYDEAMAAGPDGDSLDAFALDTGVISLPRWRGTRTRLFDAQREVFYEITGPSSETTIIGAPGNLKSRTALMRVVRELATNHAQRAGGLLLHASAFALGGRGVIVCAPKEGGKTTLLIHALRAASAEYVSNDRVLIRPGAVPYAHGVPTVVKLRQGTLDLFPALAAGLAATAYHSRLTLTEADARPAPAADQRSDSPRLSPAQLCRLVGVGARADCEVAVLVFPAFTGEPGSFTLERLSPAEVAVRLEEVWFGIRPGRWVSEVFTPDGGPPPPDRAALASRSLALAHHARGLECRLGLTAYESAGAADDLVAGLVG